MSEIVCLHKALADPLRILLVRLLMERELCVCELVSALDEPQYKISRHLGSLKRAGLLRDWREGTWMHYEISPALSAEWSAALDALRAAWDQTTEVQAALWRLQQRATRLPGSAITDCG
ncbi:MAG: ArsR/SmtB family transcription factor [Armatimonadota bacterium]